MISKLLFWYLLITFFTNNLPILLGIQGDDEGLETISWGICIFQFKEEMYLIMFVLFRFSFLFVYKKCSVT